MTVCYNGLVGGFRLLEDSLGEITRWRGGNFSAHAGFQIKHVLVRVWVSYLWLGYLNDHICYELCELSTILLTAGYFYGWCVHDVSNE